jgi:tetratricopeptide (TPR) repeat protein
MRTNIILALCVLLAAPSAAQETIKLKNGERVTGRATAYDSEKQVLSFRKSDGKEVQYTNDQLDLRSLYLVYASVIPEENGKGQLQLANVARDAGLYKHAVRRYGLAEKADPSLKAQVDSELAVLRRSAAQFCLQNAKSAQSAGKNKDVEKWCAILLDKLPAEPEAAEARTMLNLTYVAERNAKDDELEAKHKELLQQDLKDGKRRYDRMFERTKEGLTATSSGQSKDLWEGAISDGEFVLKELDRIAQDYKDDSAVQEGVVKYRRLTTDQMVEVHMHLASYYSTRTSYDNALKAANAALALDPKSSVALAQRARIEAAVADSSDRWR